MKMIICVCIYHPPGQANEVAKEAANRWTGMYNNGTAEL